MSGENHTDLAEGQQPITVSFKVTGERKIKNVWDKLKQVALGTHDKGTLQLPEVGVDLRYDLITGCAIDSGARLLGQDGQPAEVMLSITYVPASPNWAR